jgi:hypothetical protein
MTVTISSTFCWETSQWAYNLLKESLGAQVQSYKTIWELDIMNARQENKIIIHIGAPATVTDAARGMSLQW